MDEKKNKNPGFWGKIKKVLIGIGTVLLGIFLFRRCNPDGRGIRRALETNRQLRDELDRERQADEREAGRIDAERGRVVRESVRVERERERIEAERKRLEREGELSDAERKSVSTAREILERAKARTEQSKDSQRS